MLVIVVKRVSRRHWETLCDRLIGVLSETYSALMGLSLPSMSFDGDFPLNKFTGCKVIEVLKEQNLDLMASSHTLVCAELRIRVSIPLNTIKFVQERSINGALEFYRNKKRRSQHRRTGDSIKSAASFVCLRIFLRNHDKH